MRLNKRIVLFLLLASVVFIAIGILKFILFHQTFVVDIFKHPFVTPSLTYRTLTWAGGIFSLVIFMGLSWVLSIYRERQWVKLGIIIFWVWKIVLFVFFNLTFRHQHPHPSYSDALMKWLSVTNILNDAVSFGMIVSLLFVRNGVIRIYFVAFGVLMAIVYFFQYAGSFLYDGFGLRWGLVNVELLIYIAHLAPLFLFARLFDQSDKLNADLTLEL